MTDERLCDVATDGETEVGVRGDVEGGVFVSRGPGGRGSVDTFVWAWREGGDVITRVQLLKYDISTTYCTTSSYMY